MSKLLKITTILMLASFSQLTLSGYQVALPLEMEAGGGLPNGSISFGDKDNTGNGGETPDNCRYDNEHRVIQVNEYVVERPFEIGDLIFVYSDTVIGYYSPSNSKFPKPGLSKGKEMESNQYVKIFEICGDNLNDLSKYPPVGDVDEDERPPIDEDDHTGPDYTPECLPLDTTNNYAAYDEITGKYEFHSVTYGLNHIESGKKYIPPDYDPNRAGSYIYLREMNDAVFGPKPNNWYNAVCRVKKIAS